MFAIFHVSLSAVALRLGHGTFLRLRAIFVAIGQIDAKDMSLMLQLITKTLKGAKHGEKRELTNYFHRITSRVFPLSQLRESTF